MHFICETTARHRDLDNSRQEACVSSEDAVQHSHNGKGKAKPQQCADQRGDVLGKSDGTVGEGTNHGSQDEPHKGHSPNHKRQVQFRVPLEVEADLIAHLCADSVYRNDFLQGPTAVVDTARLTRRAPLADSAPPSRQAGTVSHSLEHNSNSGHFTLSRPVRLGHGGSNKPASRG